MSRAEALISRIDTVLNKFAPLTRTCYKRIVTRTGGNDLLGRPGTITTSDTIFSPQPSISMTGREPVSGGRDKVKAIMVTSGQRTADDYQLLFSTSALTVSQVQGKDVLLVLKDATGAEEVLEIMDVEPLGMENTIVALIVMARSIKRA